MIYDCHLGEFSCFYSVLLWLQSKTLLRLVLWPSGWKVWGPLLKVKTVFTGTNRNMENYGLPAVSIAKSILFRICYFFVLVKPVMRGVMYSKLLNVDENCIALQSSFSKVECKNWRKKKKRDHLQKKKAGWLYCYYSVHYFVDQTYHNEIQSYFMTIKQKRWRTPEVIKL